MRHHFLREKVEDKTISLNYVSAAGNLADLLTKALPRDTLDRLRMGMGVISRTD